MTNFNEWAYTLLYKNISLTLYSRKGDVGCVWEMSWRWGQTVILTQSSSCDHSSTSSSSWTCFLLACHPCSFCSISAENTCILFTLGTRWISCYFHLTRIWLPPLYRQILKRSSSQYPSLKTALSKKFVWYCFFLPTLKKSTRPTVSFLTELQITTEEGERIFQSKFWMINKDHSLIVWRIVWRINNSSD